MYYDSKDLSALIGSRICHDLISPIGAVSNGLELIQMTGEPLGPELDLIATSIAAAKSKIRFFRVAYGAAKPGVVLSQGEIGAILRDYFHHSRITLDWASQREVQRRDAKIAFLAIQCLESALPYGGTITVTRDKERWQIEAHHDHLRIVPELWALLGPAPVTADPPAAADVQFAMLAEITAWRKPPLACEVGETSIQMRF